MRLGYTMSLVALLAVAGCASGAMAGGDENLKESLVGKTWLARSFGDEAAMPGVHSTLLFADDGTLSGSGGCNRLNGTWELKGDELTFGPFAVTMMMCLGGRMDQESRFLGVIQKGVKLDVTNGELSVRPTNGGEAIRFVESKPAKLSGTVFYRERMALPKDAVVTVRLLDVSKMDVPSSVLANQIFTPANQVPIPFTLDYESAEIDERMTYAVDAEIRVGERLMFRSAEQHPVLTRGAATGDVEIELERMK